MVKAASVLVSDFLIQDIILCCLASWITILYYVIVYYPTSAIYLLPVRLDDSNYVPWKFLLEIMLNCCGLLKYIDGSFPWPPRHMIREEDEITSDMTKEYEN